MCVQLETTSRDVFFGHFFAQVSEFLSSLHSLPSLQSNFFSSSGIAPY